MERVEMGQFKANIHGGGGGGGGDEDEEWEMGLPAGTVLAPLCQLLIPHELASAFGISPQLNRTAEDVDRASEETVSSLQNRGEAHVPSSDTAAEEDLTGSNNSKKPRTTVDDETGGGGAAAAAAMEEGQGESATGVPAETRTTVSKRQRLVWTPELQRRFLDVIEHLGVKNAVPKTIMQMMNVEGLTRENVASHLQKYRMYIKQKQQGFFPDDATSSSSRGIHGGVGGFRQVGPPMISPPVPDLERMAMQGHHHHHHHHHYHHHIHNGTDNHGRTTNHQLHGGRGLGIGSNPYIARQNGFNKTEED